MRALTDYMKNMLQHMVTHDGSDIYLSAYAVPSMKIHGILKPIEETPLEQGRVKDIAYGIMDDDQIKEFEKTLEMNLAVSVSGVGRFRVNIFQQRNQTAMVIRNIKTEIPSLNELGLPTLLQSLIMEKRGLILFVGATGTGKSTSLASLISYRNEHSAGHIVTIEDPIEYVHEHKKSIINQREVGVDTLSYESALKNTLRQAPDVILIGEIRSRETMEHAIAFAETGHLCVSTLHANNANQAMDRIINFFPEDRHNQLFLDISLNLRAVISQRLIPTISGKRVAAIEILLGTPLVGDLIRRGELHTLKDIMKKSENVGMQTFDTALYKLYKEGVISYEDALHNADSKNNLKLQISLEEGVKADDETELSIVEEQDTSRFPGQRIQRDDKDGQLPS